MKRIVYALALMAAVGFSACTKGTYADELREEEALISKYLKRNGCTVLSTMPEDSVYASNEFYHSSSGLYYQLTRRGSGADSVSVGRKVVVRYKKYSLEENPDTINYWTTLQDAYPTTITYSSSASNACTAWIEAIGYMKFHESQARIIVPAEIGFSADQSPLTPYIYELKIRIQ